TPFPRLLLFHSPGLTASQAGTRPTPTTFTQSPKSQPTPAQPGSPTPAPPPKPSLTCTRSPRPSPPPPPPSSTWARGTGKCSSCCAPPKAASRDGCWASITRPRAWNWPPGSLRRRGTRRPKSGSRNGISSTRGGSGGKGRLTWCWIKGRLMP
ncbi:MAG: hypothetical protein Q9193_007187, partial [Seirophora villosa]